MYYELLSPRGERCVLCGDIFLSRKAKTSFNNKIFQTHDVYEMQARPPNLMVNLVCGSVFCGQLDWRHDISQSLSSYQSLTFDKLETQVRGYKLYVQLEK